MPSDAERWRFLSEHQLTLHTDGGDYGYMVHWCRTAGPGQPPKFYPVANGKTAEEAIDNAIARYARKHGITTLDTPERTGVQWLRVRGSVS
jgi:hypothetical protein